MARLTNVEKERRRINGLLAEGKDSEGNPIEEGKIVSETKNEKPPVPEIKSDFEISELEEQINNSTLGNHNNQQQDNNGPPTVEQQRKDFRDTLSTDDFTQGDKNDPNFIDENKSYNPFNAPLIENESDANRASMGGGGTSSSSGGGNTPPPAPKEFAEPIIESGIPIDTPPEKPKNEPPINPEFDKLSQSEKEKQAAMFADAILANYAQFIPMICSGVCSYDMDKIEIMDKKGELRLSMKLSKDGQDLTVREYFNNFNSKIDEIFVVTDAEKAELREPLIIVLMANNIAPTPMITLLIFFAKQTITRVFAVISLIKEKRKDLSELIELRKIEIQLEIEKHKAGQYAKAPQAASPPAEKTVVNMDEILNSKTSPAVSSNTAMVTIEEVTDPE